MNDTTLNTAEIDQESSKESSIRCRDFFNDKWKLYQKILANNYMGHQEIYNILHKFLIDNWQQPFKILDLGCGDASFVSQTLLNTNVSFYLGIDISETAIAIARENMKLIPCDQDFIQGDFSEVIPLLVQEREPKFDLILSSFTFHHLNLEQKDHIFNQLRQLLLPGGIFVLIDLVSQKGENREAYIKRYLQNVEQQWSQLTFEEMTLVSSHMLGSDYPETQKTLELLAANNGFKNMKCLYQHADNTQLCCFYV